MIAYLLGGARLTVKNAALLDGAACLDPGDGAVVPVLRHSRSIVDGRRKMGDVLGDRVLRTDSPSVNAVALASLGHGIVSGIKVFALLQVFGEVVRTGRQFAV